MDGAKAFAVGRRMLVRDNARDRSFLTMVDKEVRRKKLCCLILKRRLCRSHSFIYNILYIIRSVFCYKNAWINRLSLQIFLTKFF